MKVGENMEQKKLLTLLVVAVMVVAGAAAAVYILSDDDNDNPTIVLGVADKNGYEPMIYAYYAGFFEDEKVNVDVKWEATGGTATTSLLAGQIDMTNAGSTPVFNAIHTSPGVRIVASNCGQNLGTTSTVFVTQIGSTVDLGNLKDTFFNVDGSHNGTRIGMDATSGYYNVWTSLVDWAATEEGLSTAQVSTLKSYNPGGAIFNSQEMTNVVASLVTSTPAVDFVIGGSDVDKVAQFPSNLKYVYFPDEYLAETMSSEGCGVYIVSQKAYETNKEGILRALKAIKRAADILNDPSSPQFDDALEKVTDVVRSDKDQDIEEEFLKTRFWGIFLLADILDTFNIEEQNSASHVAGFDAWDSFAPEFLEDIWGDNPYTYDRVTGKYVANPV